MANKALKLRIHSQSQGIFSPITLALSCTFNLSRKATNCCSWLSSFNKKMIHLIGFASLISLIHVSIRSSVPPSLCCSMVCFCPKEGRRRGKSLQASPVDDNWTWFSRLYQGRQHRRKGKAKLVLNKFDLFGRYFDWSVSSVQSSNPVSQVFGRSLMCICWRNSIYNIH